MYPVVIGNGRSLQSDAIIGGYHIPKGVMYQTKNSTASAGSKDSDESSALHYFLFSITLVADPRYLPPFRCVQPGGILPGAGKVRARTMAQERRTAGACRMSPRWTENPSVCQFAVWLWSTHLHR